MSSMNIKLLLLYLLILYTITFRPGNGLGQAIPDTATSPSMKKNKAGEKEKFTTITKIDTSYSRAHAAGSPDAKVGILFVHDFFGASDAGNECLGNK